MPLKIVDAFRTLDNQFNPRMRTGKLYAMPSYLDVHVKSATATWQAWTANPAISDPRWRSAIEIPISEQGEITVMLPWTDTEVYRGAGGSVLWQIWDPDAGMVYSGALPSSLGAGPKSLKELCALESGAWTVRAANNVRGIARGSKVFNSPSGVEQTVSLSPAMPDASYAVYAGGAWDDLSGTYYKAGLKPGTRTADGFVIRIDAEVASGRTVEVFWRAEMPGA